MNPTDIVIAFLRAHGTLDTSGFAALAAVFVVTGLVPVPRTALCLASGALFGPVAILVIMPSTTLGGIAAFLLARTLLADRLHRMAGARPRWRAVLQAVDSEGWRIVGLLRFAGAVPTFAQNYLFGLTRIGLVPFTLATFVFTIPQVCLYVYIGALGRAALLEEKGGRLGLILAAMAVLCLALVVIVVGRKARAALRGAQLAD